MKEKGGLVGLGLFLSVVGFLLGGCLVVDAGDDADIEITDDECFSRCEERNETCDYGYEVDCRELCDAIDSLECDQELIDYDDCREETGDVCGEPSECSEEEAAFKTCLEEAETE